jgi:hypothetical protein
MDRNRTRRIRQPARFTAPRFEKRLCIIQRALPAEFLIHNVAKPAPNKSWPRWSQPSSPNIHGDLGLNEIGSAG